MVFNALIVANIREDGPETAHLAVGVGGDEQPALQHHLKQAYRLERDGFPAGVGTGNNQHAFLSLQLQRLRLGVRPAGCILHGEQRVVSLDEVKVFVRANAGQVGVHFTSQLRLGTGPIQFDQQPMVRAEVGQKAPNLLRQCTQDAMDFLAFIVLEHLHFEVHGHC